MNTRTWITLAAMLTVPVLLASCAPMAQPTRAEATQVVAAEVVVEAAPTQAPQKEAPPTPVPTPAAQQDLASTAPLTAGRPNRLIVKNAEVKLLVADTEVAIDRVTQIVADAGGYIISSRVWYQAWYEENFKYASITMGVPVEQFEWTLRRLRGVAVRVLDENASGQDVTDEYVDLQSRLDNLQATRDRIREFLGWFPIL